MINQSIKTSKKRDRKTSNLLSFISLYFQTFHENRIEYHFNDLNVMLYIKLHMSWSRILSCTSFHSRNKVVSIQDTI